MSNDPLVVLAWEGPILRAYVAALRDAEMTVSRIVQVTPSVDPATRTPVGRWMPASVRLAYASHLFAYQMNFWPRKLLGDARLQRAMFPLLSRRFVFFDRFRDSLRRALHRSIAPVADHLLIDRLDDAALLEKVGALAPASVLYTGGGIVPRALLSLPGIRVLHVHPGVLPRVGGADGLLWSALIEGRPGRTAFWMTPELDAGPVIATEACEPLAFPIADAERPDDQMLYRALFAFYDPCLRAELLVKLLRAGPLPTAKPPLEPTQLYTFMNKVQRQEALRVLFPKA
jgi:hypothetical protein